MNGFAHFLVCVAEPAAAKFQHAVDLIDVEKLQSGCFGTVGL